MAFYVALSQSGRHRLRRRRAARPPPSGRQEIITYSDLLKARDVRQERHPR
jgi:hypothetical protein